MIPVLYEKSEKTFTNNGIGFLSDASKATVTEERNGIFELSMQYPLGGIWFERIETGSIIKAKANETSEPQLFRVYKISKPLQGIVTYSAEHISYDLNGIPTLGLNLNASTAEAAMNQTVNGAVTPCAYSVYSDIPDKRTVIVEPTASVRAAFASIRDTFGGELEFDNFTVKLHKSRGNDNGVTIEYGKNLTDLKQESNISECYTHILPYAHFEKEPEEYEENAESETVYIYLSEKIIPIPGAESFGHIKVFPVDFSDRFEDGAEYTESALRILADDFLSDTDIGVPRISLSISFVQLWQTEEYKNIAPLERVRLCDIVTVKFPRLGIESKSEVVKTVFDVLSEHYESIDLGDVKETLADTVIETEKALKTIKKSTDRIESHIRRTDDRITLEVLHIVENEKELSSRIELTESSITAEVSRATAEEGKLSSRITQTSESITAEVTAKITTETERAEKKEEELSSRITQTSESITAEVTRATGEEEELSSRITQTATSISSEITRAKNAESTLSSKITQTVNAIRLSVSSRTNGNDTDTTISVTNGTATLNSVVITGTTSKQAATIAADAIKGITLSHTTSTANNQTSSVLTLKNGNAALSSTTIVGTTAEQAATIAADAVKGITLTVSNSTTGASSTLTMKSGSTTLSSAKIEFTGLVTFANLKDGKTEISGDNITTGKISAERIDTSTIYLDRLYSNVGGRKVVIDTYTGVGGSATITVGGSGTTTTSNVSVTGVLASRYVYIGYNRYNGSFNKNLVFDVSNRYIYPSNTGSYGWSLGTSGKPFSNFYTTTANIGMNSTSKIAFFGATPQFKQTGVKTLENLITALKNYGLIG